MSKISLIIKREYFSRVKKKSFIIMTILGPILMASIGIVPVYLSMKGSKTQKVEVVDESLLFSYTNKEGLSKGLIPEDKDVHFDYPPISLDQARAGFFDTDYDAILWIPKNVLNGGQKGIHLYFKEQMNISIQSYIEENLSKMIFNVMLVKNNVNPDFVKEATGKSTFKMFTSLEDKSGKSKPADFWLHEGIGFACAFSIYFFIFLYGVQVMRGVMEEKTSRIVEVILSSVKPFQLMMGKIVGIALVGLTQFLLWIVLTGTLYGVASVTILKNIDIKQAQAKEQVVKIGSDINVSQMKENQEPDMITNFFNASKNIELTDILLSFLFYFLAGYLLYAALFAAVGSAVDSEADTQQFMMSITIPLILSIFISINVMQDPHSTMAFWFSIIPFTSPIVMMVRIAFSGVPPWEVALSMTLLVLGFLFTTWIAGRIYRTGILMYGKKVTWKELGKWLFFKG